jgi:hypothetical protein
VPAGLDQDHPPTWCQPGQEVRFVPIPDLVAHMLGIGVLTRADGVIDNRAVGAKADNGGADACRVVFPAIVKLPAAGGMAVVREPHAKCGAVPRDQVANPAAPFLRQLGRVRRRKDCAVLCIRHHMGREQDRSVGRFCRTRRHEHRESLDLAARHPLQAIDQQPMVRRRLISTVARPLEEASSDAPPLQQQFRRHGRRDVQPTEFGLGRRCVMRETRICHFALLGQRSSILRRVRHSRPCCVSYWLYLRTCMLGRSRRPARL